MSLISSSSQSSVRISSSTDLHWPSEGAPPCPPSARHALALGVVGGASRTMGIGGHPDCVLGPLAMPTAREAASLISAPWAGGAVSQGKRSFALSLISAPHAVGLSDSVVDQLGMRRARATVSLISSSSQSSVRISSSTCVCVCKDGYLPGMVASGGERVASGTSGKWQVVAAPK